MRISKRRAQHHVQQVSDLEYDNQFTAQPVYKKQTSPRQPINQPAKPKPTPADSKLKEQNSISNLNNLTNLNETTIESKIKDNIEQTVVEEAKNQVGSQCRIIVVMILTNLFTSLITITGNTLVTKYLPFASTSSTSSTKASASAPVSLQLQNNPDDMTQKMYDSQWTYLERPQLFSEINLNDIEQIMSFENVISVNSPVKFLQITAIQKVFESGTTNNSEENWVKITVKNGLSTFVHWMNYPPSLNFSLEKESTFVIPCQNTREIRVQSVLNTTISSQENTSVLKFYVVGYQF